MFSISPSGRIYFNPSAKNERRPSIALDNPIARAFSIGNAEGLLALAGASNAAMRPAAYHFWRDFSVTYFNALCQQGAVHDPSPVALPSEEEIDAMLLNVPPMLGAEYCTYTLLTDLWIGLDAFVREKITAFEKGLPEFIAATLPQWHHIGRICFHLAENKQDAEYPFAFMAAYANAMGKNTRVQYQPLHRALQEYAGAGNKQQLINLLNPIHAAAKQCAWVRALLTSRDIYHPLAWTPQEAYTFLNSVAEVEAHGIIVRLPDWWKKRPRPRVQVSIGHAKKESLTIDTLLDFQLSVAIGDTPLTKAELDALLSADTGLMSLRGQWVEVDSEQLQAALTQWQTIQEEVAEEGLSFIEGMRLLAGTDKALTANADNSDCQDSWVSVHAGGWLKEKLAQLRDPTLLQAKHPGKQLKATLRPYQLVGVTWLDFLTQLGLGACLADDMGLGKTIQIIALLLMQKKQRSHRRPNLLILPASLLSNWRTELARFAPSLSALYVHASELSNNQLEALSTQADALQGVDLVVTTYGMVLRQPWFHSPAWELVILDEAQAIKNPGAKQTKSVKTLKSKARITLTGTPIENKLGDLWSLFDFLCPGLLGSASRFKRYLKEVESQAHPFAPLKKLVQPYILRRLKTDRRIIDDLPDKTELVAWCGLSKAQASLYAQSVNELHSVLAGASGIKRKGLVLSFMLRFKQICNHPSQALNDGQYRAKDSGKFLRVAEICEEIAARQEKVLVFTQFREMTGPLFDFLSHVFGQPGLVLHGGTPIKKRKALVDQFQSDAGPPFFVLSLRAAGTGLNLTAASHVIHFDRWWNPAVENQATDRAFRIGQKKNVLVHKCVCRGTVEEKIDRMIQEKVQLATDVLEVSGESLLTELDDHALLELVSLDLEKAHCPS